MPLRENVVDNTAVLSHHTGQGNEFDNFEKLCTTLACSTYDFPVLNKSSQNGHLSVKLVGYLEFKNL